MSDFIMGNMAIRVVGAYDPAGVAKDDLYHVLGIAFNHNRSAIGWTLRDGALLLFWGDGGFDLTRFLSPLDRDEAHRTVVAWLRGQKMVHEISGGDTDEEPHAFEAWTDQWGHGGGDSYALIAVKPRTRWIDK